tara:strand:- start:2 stop:181 length:180 start_codon:yes stop_codon:yes gene_type:complete
MIKVKFDISKIDSADALNMIDEEMICETVEFNQDNVMLVGTQDGNISVEIDWITDIKEE